MEYFRAAVAFASNDLSASLDLGSELRDLGRLDDAAAVYRQIVAKHPRALHGWRGLGLLARQRGDLAEALDHFLMAVAAEPGNSLALQDFAMGLLEVGRLDEAAATFSEIVKNAPRYMHGWRGLGMVARQRGDRAEALENFRAAAALEPDNLLTLHDVAMGLRELGRPDEAEAAYGEVVTKDPRHVASWRGLGLTARQRGDHAEALENFRTAATLDPENIWTLLDVATELRELALLNEAAAAYRDIATRFPEIVHGWRGLGQLARQRGDRAEALEHFRTAEELDPENAMARLDVATELYELGRLDEASTAYRAVVARDPRVEHGWRGLARLARQRGDRAEALEHFRRAAAIEPEHVWTWQDVAIELRELGHSDDAEALLKAKIAQNPDSAEAIIAYANAIRHRASPGEIIALLEKAVAKKPDYLQAKLALAGEYTRSWRLDDAEALYDTALSEHEDNAQALMGKGQIMRRRGHVDAALKFFETAAMRPAAPEWATCEFSRQLVDAGLFDEARQVLINAISRHPNEPIFHMHLGQNARAIGDHSAAFAAFSAAALLNPGQPQAEIELAVEEFRLGRTSLAVDRLKGILTRHPTSTQALEALANIAQALDDVPGAVALRQKALEIDASNLWSHMLLAQGLEKLGRAREADEILARCEAKFGPAPEAVVVKAGLLKDRGDLALVREELDKGAARFPAHFDLWFHRVMALIASGAFDEAKRETEAPPGCSAREKVRSSMLRGQIAAAQWEVDKAYAHFVDALRFDPTDSWAHDWAARMSMLQLDLESAQRHLEASVRVNPTHRFLNRGASKPSQTHIGQMLDEFRMDRAALQQLRDGLVAENSVAAVAKLVLDLPDYTPAAISLMVTLRQIGLFAAPESNGGEASPIPTRIVQFWDEDIPADVEALCEGWRAAHPTFSYSRFSNAEARRYLAEMGPAGALEAFNRAVEPAMKADIFRLAYLYHEGGFYVDADDRCLAPLSTVDPGGRDLILYQEDFGTVANNFIGAIPKHPAIGLALNSAIEAINRGDADMVWLSTGPALLTRSVAFHLAEHLPERLARTLILERYELFAAVAIHCVTSYKYTQRHWSHTAFSRSRAGALASIDSMIEPRAQAPA